MGAIGVAIRAVVRAQGRWRAVTRTEADGALVVAVVRPGGPERVVRRLPADLEGYELTAELELAREEAQRTAEQLNR